MANSTTRPTLRTKRLILRPVAYDDASAVARGLNDADVSRWLSRVPHPYSRDDAKAWIDSVERGADNKDEIALGIELDGEIIGAVGVHDLRSAPTLGFWLAREHWGQGYMSEAVGTVLMWAFEVLSVASIRSGAFVGNDASLALQRRFGFNEVGRSTLSSRARGEEMEHIDTYVTADEYRAAVRGGRQAA